MNEQLDKKELKLLQRGDRDTIERWFNAYADALYTSVFYRLDKNHDKAVEVVEETFLAGLRQIEQYVPEQGSMFTWLSGLRREALKKLAGSEVRKVPLSLSKIEVNLLSAYRKIGTELLPNEVIERGETAEMVQMTLSSIRSDYRDVLKDYYYGMKPLKEIADLAGVSEREVGAILYRARKVFKQVFLKLCSVSGDAGIAGGGSDG